MVKHKNYRTSDHSLEIVPILAMPSGMWGKWQHLKEQNGYTSEQIKTSERSDNLVVISRIDENRNPLRRVRCPVIGTRI